MLIIDTQIQPQDLQKKIDQMWALSAEKILSIAATHQGNSPAPVFTVNGKYTAKGWTQWTQGFQYGSAILQFQATGETAFLKLGKHDTLNHMADHLTHFGVHDHGFNNISTYGNLLRLMNQGKIAEDPCERNYYSLALKVSGAVQAKRWIQIHDRTGFVYSFNGPHSLFADTIRSMRSLALAHQLGHSLLDEHDQQVSLYSRLVQHAINTSKYIVFFGKGRDQYDIPGRVAHEAIFNLNDGQFRCPSTQQGYSPFTTWTRGLAWIILGYAEQIEFLETQTDQSLATLKPLSSRQAIYQMFLKTALATADFYLQQMPADGIPYWDTGAPNLHKIKDYHHRPADPTNDFEPVDSSAAAIAAQGLIRLGHYLKNHQQEKLGDKYLQAGLTILNTLLDTPYLSKNVEHQGLLLHSIYHHPNGWDQIPSGKKIPSGQSSMWGDYHLREAVTLVQSLNSSSYDQFFISDENKNH